MRKQYKIWVEGFSATGQHSTAQYLGTQAADSFREACDMYYLAKAKESYWKNTVLDPNYNSEIGSYWGCKLFDNEAEARRRFG